MWCHMMKIIQICGNFPAKCTIFKEIAISTWRFTKTMRVSTPLFFLPWWVPIKGSCGWMWVATVAVLMHKSLMSDLVEDITEGILGISVCEPGTLSHICVLLRIWLMKLFSVRGLQIRTEGPSRLSHARRIVGTVFDIMANRVGNLLTHHDPKSRHCYSNFWACYTLHIMRHRQDIEEFTGGNRDTKMTKVKRLILKNIIKIPQCGNTMAK